MFYRFKSVRIQTGKDIHAYNTRQRPQHRRTSHKLELTVNLPQNIDPKLFIHKQIVSKITTKTNS